MPDTPLRGADTVNDELEVGYDAGFERWWVRAEIAGRVVMAGVVAAGLAGLLGRGPFSHRTTATASGAIGVDYEPVARYGTETQVTLHVDTSRLPPGPMTVHLTTVLVEPMGLHEILPQPAAEQPEHDGVAVTIPHDGEQDSYVRLFLKPSTVGRKHLTATIEGETIAWSQLVLP